MLTFIHIQKTAGTTIERILRQNFGNRHCNVEKSVPGAIYSSIMYGAEDHKKILRLYPNLESIAGHQVKPFSDLETICSDIQYYSFLRNPISRTASHFQYHVQRMGEKRSFEEWIKDSGMHNIQTKHLAGKDDFDIAVKNILEKDIFLGLVEKFDESLVLIRKNFADYELDIRYVRENIASDSSIKENLISNKRTLSLLQDANTNDIKLYNWACSEIYEEQRNRFGQNLNEEVAHFIKTNQDSSHGSLNINEILHLVKRNILYKPLRRYTNFFGS